MSTLESISKGHLKVHRRKTVKIADLFARYDHVKGITVDRYFCLNELIELIANPQKRGESWLL